MLSSLQWAVPFGSSRSLARYDDGDISFSYPAGWHRAVGSGTLTTQGCVGCGFVLSSQRLLPGTALLAHALAPGGVLVTWGWSARGEVAISQVPGSPTTIGGRAAKVTDTKGDCSGLDADNADQSITATIADGGGHGWGHEMNACLRAPGLDRVKAQVLSMLRSVSFPTSAR
jgi:hypothetical protein